MNHEQQLELSRKFQQATADEMDTELIKTIQDKVDSRAGNSKLAELQATASAVQKKSKEEEWNDITTYNMEDIPPVALARLLAALPRAGNTYYTLPVALMVAIEAHKYGLDPFKNEVYPTGGSVGFSLEGQKKIAVNAGYIMSVPQFEEVKREWPKDKVLRYKWDGREQDYKTSDGKDWGVICRMTVNEQPVEYTCWLSEWMVPTSPHWRERTTHMLKVRSQSKAIAFGTGIGVSDDLVEEDGSRPAVRTEVKAPKETPFAGR